MPKILNKNLNFIALNKTKTNLDFSVPNSFKTKLYFLDIQAQNSINQINVNLGLNSEVDIVVSSFATPRVKKHYAVKMNHLNNNAKSTFRCYAVGAKKSDILIKITSDIKPKTSNNNTIQQIKGVLLSDDASIHGEPQLIIDDNNVKAIHAMAIGRINPSQIFYLMSRGIDKNVAIQLILMGYFNATIQILEDLELQNLYHDQIEKLFKGIQ